MQRHISTGISNCTISMRIVYPAKVESRMHLNNNHRDPIRLSCVCMCEGIEKQCGKGLKNYCIR